MDHSGHGGLLVLLALAWFGYFAYIRWVVVRSPATTAIIHTEQGDARLGVYQDGNQVALPDNPSPTQLPTTVPLVLPSPTPLAETPIPPLPTKGAATPGPNRPILPPTRVRIPKIGVNASVVVGDENHLPQFKGVGWYMGSGYPGFRGNMVLFGHLNGVYETFGRLHQLAGSDTVLVDTAEQTYTYMVTSTRTVPETTVAVLAPTNDHRLTPITCEGVFFPTTCDYSDRRVVIATLADY